LMCGLFETTLPEFFWIDEGSHANVSPNWSGAKIRAPSSTGYRSASNYIGHWIRRRSYIALMHFLKTQRRKIATEFVYKFISFFEK
jgi:hypothetical protein